MESSRCVTLCRNGILPLFFQRIMNANRVCVFAVALGFTVLCFGQVSPTKLAETPRTLVGEVVEVLDTKDVSKIRRFVQTWLIPNSPVEQRVNRWKDLADNGAPFKIARDMSQTADQITVIIVDRFGARIALTMHFESKPRLMISGLQLAPALKVEGSSPDLGKWSDYSALAKLVAAKSKSPGLGIAVIRNGEASFGISGVRKLGGKEPIRVDDVWSIGSIGKSVCSSVIGHLIEQGKLSWNEPLSRALPGVKMDLTFGHITLDQIMHHRGGIAPDLGFGAADIKRIVGNAKTPTAIRNRYMADILGRKPVIAAGDQFIYSNAGYALLSVIAERAAGKAYETLVREVVFTPLGLKHSYIGIETLPKQRPSGHFDGQNGPVPGDMSGPMESMFAGAGGGIYMSVGDLAKYGNAHLKGLKGQNGFLKASTIAKLHRGFPEQLRGGRLYACGWGIDTLPGVLPFHGHNGSNGTMRAQLAIFPGANLVVAAIVNRGGEDDPAPGMQAVMAVAERYAKAK